MSRVLVTGGSSGLGAALVEKFRARGDQVLVTDLAAAGERGSGAAYLHLDVTAQDDWDAALAWVRSEWGGLDILVNNAGIATGGRIDVATLEEWQRVIDVNLLGVVRGCRTFTPLLKEQGHGRLVNTASAAGLVHPPGMASYNAVKAGVVALSETLRWELEPFGVQVTVVCPTFFRTNLASSLTGSDTVLNRIAERLITRSTVTADEIAAEVVKAVDAGRYLVLPDEGARKAFFAKRFLTPLYERQQRGFAARIQQAAAAESETGTETETDTDTATRETP
ncbi:MAG TPA: SDR family NAD(P)-dependent oxidoreductase [Marmoricola sp.]|nr:SDR family NAD(P)-dependent oxidoreductase [Marmoricola sp.]